MRQYPTSTGRIKAQLLQEEKGKKSRISVRHTKRFGYKLDKRPTNYYANLARYYLLKVFAITENISMSTFSDQYTALRIVIFFLQAIAPTSVGYTLSRWWISELHRLPRPLEIYCALEFLFYVLVYHPRRIWLQREATYPVLPAREERERLFTQCHDHVADPELHLARWFNNPPVGSVKRGNLKQFLSWAFINCTEISEEYEEEIEGYTQGFEHVLGRKLEPGFNPDVSCLRLNFDPVSMSHRSLLWYTLVMMIDLLMSMYIALLGFDYFPTTGRLDTIPPRPQSLLASRTKQSPAKNMSYWLYPHTSTTKMPVVFLHGIGIGLWPYLPMLNDMIKANPDVGILAIEVMPISMRICHSALNSQEFCAQFDSIVSHHGFNKFVIMSHSYGTVLTTQLLHSPSLAKKIDSIVLIDPISFMLHLPNVAYNFVKRKPSSATEWLLWYFASQDMGISHTLGRSFFWTENILWKEELSNVRKATIVLSGQDLLVDVSESWRYLTDEKDVSVDTRHDQQDLKEKPRKWMSRNKSVTVMCYDALDHGQVFETKDRREPVIKALQEINHGKP